MKLDPKHAQRAIEGHFKGFFRKAENKAAIAVEAVEQLRLEPPTKEQSNSGPQQVDEQFLNRFETYAEQASTDEMRAKWARVLASEIRTPGKFSGKALRVIDEIDAKTANAFEKLCEHRLEHVLPIPLVGKIGFDDMLRLDDAGLIIDPGIAGHIRIFSAGSFGTEEIWSMTWDKLGGFCVPKSKWDEVLNKTGELFSDKEGVPAMPIYILTDTGQAIASILPNKQQSALRNLIDTCRARGADALREIQINPYARDATQRFIVK